jgi:hypothetical protein
MQALQASARRAEQLVAERDAALQVAERAAASRTEMAREHEALMDAHAELRRELGALRRRAAGELELEGYSSE